MHIIPDDSLQWSFTGVSCNEKDMLPIHHNAGSSDDLLLELTSSKGIFMCTI